MPSLSFSQAMTANQLGLNPFVGWQYEFIPAAWMRGAAVSILARATGVSVRQTVYTGGQTIQERSPVQAGGTAGVTPSPLNTTPLSFVAAPGDRLKMLLDEVGGVTPTVDLLIQVEPL